MSGPDVLVQTVRLGEPNPARPPDPIAAAKETIHSGHFMVSDFEREEGEEEERLNAPILDDVSGDSDSAAVESVKQDSPSSGQKLSIDGSLTKLFNTLTIAYKEQISNPRWNMFKGMKLNMKDKIRLNNVIWRCWHIQFVKMQNRGVCHFASSAEGEQHKPVSVVLEGKYWKRKPEAVTAEYKKWRMFNKNRVCRHGSRVGVVGFSNALPPPDWPASLSSSLEVGADDMDLDFSDGLMDMLMQQPYTFPNPREIRVGVADFIQPSLVQLQPNLSDMDFMDTLEPLQEWLCSRLPTVDEEPPPLPPPPPPLLEPHPMLMDSADGGSSEPTRLGRPPPPPPAPPTKDEAPLPDVLSFQPAVVVTASPALAVALPAVTLFAAPRQRSQSTRALPTLTPRPAEAPLRRSSLSEVQHSRAAGAMERSVSDSTGVIALIRGACSGRDTPPGAGWQLLQSQHQRQLQQQQQQQKQQQHHHQQHQQQQQHKQLHHQQQQHHHQKQQQLQHQPQSPQQVTMLGQLLTPSCTGQINQGALASIVAAGASPPPSPSPSLTFSMPSPPQLAASPPEPAAGRGVYREHRRACHINAEQKRRGSIKSGFDVLYGLVPALRNNSAVKVSKAAMLHHGADYIKEMKTERSKLQAEAEDLKREIERLNQQINNCQAMLPATGAPVTRAKQSKMQEMFEDYVRERTLQNWKFFVFSKLLPPLLESYSTTVSTANVDELCRTVLTWQEQSCGLVQFRPRATMALCDLSKTTSILSDPTRLPMEAINAVTRIQRPPGRPADDAADAG